MRQAHTEPAIETRGRGLAEITRAVADRAAGTDRRDGLLTIFLRHTSASLPIQENADAGVQRDLERFFARLVPDGDRLFEHDAEGADDMPESAPPLAHRAVLPRGNAPSGRPGGRMSEAR